MLVWPYAKYVPSPNYNERPDEQDVSLVVLHNISLPPGAFGGGYVQQFFLNELNFDSHPYFQSIRGLQVSAHCFIDRMGKVTQFVPFEKRAWHAGKSVYLARENCNDFSVGIELEGTDVEPYTENQYDSLVSLVAFLIQKYPKITVERIVGHSDIAPVRKTDPGPAFDWSRFRYALGHALEQENGER